MDNVFWIQTEITGWLMLGGLFFIITLCLLLISTDLVTPTIVPIKVKIILWAFSAIFLGLTVFLGTQKPNERIKKQEMSCKQVGAEIHCKLVQ